MKKLAYVAILAIASCQSPETDKENEAELIARGIFEAFNAHVFVSSYPFARSSLLQTAK